MLLSLPPIIVDKDTNIAEDIITECELRDSYSRQDGSELEGNEYKVDRRQDYSELENSKHEVERGHDNSEPKDNKYRDSKSVVDKQDNSKLEDIIGHFL